MEPADNTTTTATDKADQTRILLEQLSAIICRLQSQLDEVSQQLELSLNHQTEVRSQPHIIALRSLKASLQAELKNNQATLDVLSPPHCQSSTDNISRY